MPKKYVTGRNECGDKEAGKKKKEEEYYHVRVVVVVVYRIYVLR